MGLRVRSKSGLARSRKPVAQRTYKRERRRVTARRIVGSTLILLFLAVGTGIAYTWYMGQYSAPVIQAAQSPKRQVQVKPPNVSQTTRVGVAVQTITSPVKRGENASLSIRTNPLASCSVTVEYDKVLSKDSGLKAKQSDEFGTATWSWTVESTRPLGTWPVKVTCKNKKNSAVVETNFVIER